LLARILADSRYQRNLDWGEPRHGHPEGTVRGHIEELLNNLESLRPRLRDDEYWKLQLLIHVHDSFKAEARPGVAITHPRSHASLARAFLAEFCDDADLSAMVQFHDEPYALWRKSRQSGALDRKRFDALLSAIRDWDLFVAFLIVDGCTLGKSRTPLHWFLQMIHERIQIRFTAADLL
jgi:hypothetical protein